MVDTLEPSILIVDDNETTASISAFNFEVAGFSVEIARDGQEALKIATANTFDVIVTDENMPRLSGREFVQELRKDKRYADTPVIFVTGKGFELERAQLATDLGVSAVVIKPFSPRGLVKLVHTVIA